MDLKLQKNIWLKNYSTYKIGGKADYFFVAKNEKEIFEAIKWAQKNRLPFFVLGGGSNVLFSDKGFRGLVIKIENSQISFQKEKLIAGAGCKMEDLVSECLKRGLSGLEWAAGLPGTLGGAIRGNAGAFGGEIKDVVEKVITFLPMKNKIKCYQKRDCQFGYRESIFKKNKEIIISAVLKLKKGNIKKLKKIIKDHISYRKSHHPLEFPNAGSVFKNCPLAKVPPDIQKKFKDKIKNDPLPILPTAVLIAQTGLLNKSFGGAKISEKHPNFIINFNKAKARDIIELKEKIKKEVKKKFRVNLEEEIELVGF